MSMHMSMLYSSHIQSPCSSCIGVYIFGPSALILNIVQFITHCTRIRTGTMDEGRLIYRVLVLPVSVYIYSGLVPSY
jgi:hypothetical protein